MISEHSPHAPSSTDLPEENWHVKKPVLFVAATRDYVCRAALHKATMQKYAPHAEIVELDSGHWPQFEATDELNKVLEKWIENVRD